MESSPMASSPNTTLAQVVEYAMDAKTNYDLYIKEGSLTSTSALTVVEPLTIVSRDLLSYDKLPDVNQTLLSVFSAYYLQAINTVATVKDIEVVKILNSVNPNTDLTGLAVSMATSLESVSDIAHPSASLENYDFSLPTTKKISIEEKGDNKDVVNQVSNLSVGKVLDVDIAMSGLDKDNKPTTYDVTVPVTVRLQVTPMGTDSLVRMVTSKEVDANIVERFHDWRAGRISFIKDLVLCQDLITEHKKAALDDDSDVLSMINTRALKKKTSAVITRTPSLAVASNLLVISETVAKSIETKFKGKLDNKRVIEKLFKDNYLMVVFVVDREWERVTIYTRDKDGSTDLSMKEIQNANASKGNGIDDILKAMQMGSGNLL